MLALLALVVVTLLLFWRDIRTALRLFKIRRGSEDELEDHIYHIATLNLSFEATVGRILRVSERWTRSDGACLIFKNKATQEVTMSTVAKGQLIKNQTSFSKRDLISLGKLFQKPRHKFIQTVDVKHRQPRAYKLLVSYNIDVLFILRARNRVVGFLGFSRAGGKIDQFVLAEVEVAAKGMVVALESAQVREQLNEVNSSLEQRIKTAIGDLERSNQQLQQLDQAKDDFIAMASHQLRTPLTSIKGYLSLVLEGDVGEITPEQRQALDEAFQATRSMTHVIHDFLNVSRLQTGRFMFDKKRVNLVDLIEDEIKNMKDVVENYQLKLKTEIEPKLPGLMDLDEAKVRQAFGNLLDNAIFYSKPKGLVEIEVNQAGGAIVVTIKDQGVGVPSDERSGLFKKFYRASTGRKQRPDGTGIGLYLAKEIIEGHGGSVFYEPNQPEGSVFGFSLPISRRLNPGIHIESQN